MNQQSVFSPTDFLAVFEPTVAFLLFDYSLPWLSALLGVLAGILSVRHLWIGRKRKHLSIDTPPRLPRAPPMQR